MREEKTRPLLSVVCLSPCAESKTRWEVEVEAFDDLPPELKAGFTMDTLAKLSPERRA
jgi:hypothetical protein